jgi:hypothetical protein
MAWQQTEFRSIVDRYYDPATGQFLTVDPDVSETGEPYAYTDGDPANVSDPMGTCPWCILDPWSGANPIRIGAEHDPGGLGTSLIERLDPAFSAVQGFATGNYVEGVIGSASTVLIALGGAEVVGDLAVLGVTDSADAAAAGSMDLPASETWGDPETLAEHFASHGPDFDAATADEYAQGASSFFQRALREDLPTKIDPKTGVIRIFDPDSNTFGAYNTSGTTRTFFTPDPAVNGYPTNWDYWDSQPGYSPWEP